MYIFENPVLQRELLVNLRTRRAMMLLIGYNLVLGCLVFLAWPQQRRLDLIPNLVATVKGYVKEESTVLTNIANARAGVIAAGSNAASSIQANKQLDVAISPLLRLQEAYPDLKSNQQFIRLTDELAGTENRIAVERQKYNKTLEDYNIYVRQFPNSIWAGMAGYHYRDEYYTGDAASKTAPKVDFDK